MLGVRHYKNCAVDLWCGEPRDFITDLSITSWTLTPDLAGKHVGVEVSPSDDASQIMETLKTDLDGTNSRPRRVSFLTPDLEHYKKLQAALFACFPEADDE